MSGSRWRNRRVGVSHCWSRAVSECGAAFSHGLDPQRKWKFAHGARSFEATIVPSGGSVPRVREHVVGSDLLLAYPLCPSSKHSLPLGGLWREKEQGCAGRNSGATR